VARALRANVEMKMRLRDAAPVVQRPDMELAILATHIDEVTTSKRTGGNFHGFSLS